MIALRHTSYRHLDRFILATLLFSPVFTYGMTTSSKLDAASIARLSLHDANDFSIQLAETQHRIELLQHWDIPAGANVLELGCGQGDCTTVLASAIGEQGSVVAVDPASLDYGVVYRQIQLPDGLSDEPTCRIPIHPRTSAKPHLARSTGQAHFLDPTVSAGLPLYPLPQ